ncbi:hypothetical protein NW761_012320 [Fusarium oxysporum]|nr:hypothetical protein NW758_010771 [Fusarium oxysporum]KAJ4035526.1 hypothetical protein NW753_012034 [Fusarium oxysporum]KAJ4048108.1 hypothetical protein NW763_009518 [Fusarium oxysporum]KAJ4073691.1 hypothetical protein NW756_014140 [Fusarium oxysporum]KAJ4077342.1 hypothetical protein NW761_012320 [Fusarium oxysporum]
MESKARLCCDPPAYLYYTGCLFCDRDLASWLTCPGYSLSTNAQSHFKTFKFQEECVYSNLVSTNHKAKSKHWSCVCGVEKVIEVVRKQRFVSKLGVYIEA